MRRRKKTPARIARRPQLQFQRRNGRDEAKREKPRVMRVRSGRSTCRSLKKIWNLGTTKIAMMAIMVIDRQTRTAG